MDNKKILFITFLGTLGWLPAKAETNFSVPTGASAAEYIVYLINFLIGIGTLAAVVMFVMAGIGWVTAHGESGKIDEAKGKIKNAVLGLVILFSSYLILNTINSQLTKITISAPSASSSSETVEGAGAYLYDGTSFSSTTPALLLTTSAANLSTNGFKGQAKSVRFVNPTFFNYGAVMYSGTDMRGQCSWTTSDISDTAQAVGNQNNPPVGPFSSISVFKEDPSNTASIVVYNAADCMGKSNAYCIEGDDTYPCQTDDNKRCKISSAPELQKIEDVCSDFIGSVLSFSISPAAGVLIEDKGGHCQYFESSQASCINVVKDSYVYSPLLDKPYSIIVFPLYK